MGKIKKEISFTVDVKKPAEIIFENHIEQSSFMSFELPFEFIAKGHIRIIFSDFISTEERLSDSMKKMFHELFENDIVSSIDVFDQQINVFLRKKVDCNSFAEKVLAILHTYFDRIIPGPCPIFLN